MGQQRIHCGKWFRSVSRLFVGVAGDFKLILFSVMGELHKDFRICHMKKQYAKNACAHLIADSGHCVRDTLVVLTWYLLTSWFCTFVVNRLP